MSESKSLFSVIPLRNEVLVEITHEKKNVLDADGSAIRIKKSVVVGIGNFVIDVEIGDRVVLSNSKFNVINVMDGKEDKLYALVDASSILYKLDETKISEDLEEKIKAKYETEKFSKTLIN